ncbi:MAG: hypothetical protein LLF78_03260 [Synergistaceae bacterium]|nr:hypothetical protein [Synergistaceae bacterium]
MTDSEKVQEAGQTTDNYAGQEKNFLADKDGSMVMTPDEINFFGFCGDS